MTTTQQQSNNVVDYAYTLLRHLLGADPVEPFTIQTKGSEGCVTVPNTVCLKQVDPAYHSFRFDQSNVQISFAVN